jgi:hypothetical protein
MKQSAEVITTDISSMERVGDNLWRFNARMQCCCVNGAIPVLVPMWWNGDTPMIMMTDTSLPGVGTFTVRVFFYGDRYAGTWKHDAVGGHMSGRIEKQTPVASESSVMRGSGCSCSCRPSGPPKRSQPAPSPESCVIRRARSCLA